MTITFGELKRRIEELTCTKTKYDDTGIVLTFPNITFHIGYENQWLILTNNNDKTYSMYNNVDGLLKAINTIKNEYKRGE